MAGSAGAQPAPAAAGPAKDALGRDTPRGTLLGFIGAAREEHFDLAALYLNTSLRDTAAADLARQLYVVLDARLPARLPEVSDQPDGSRANPLKPDQDLIGTIATDQGSLDVLVERVARGPGGRVWLFSRRTLDAIPEVYDEVHLVPIESYLPSMLVRVHVAGIRLFDWLVFLVALPLLYYLLGLVGRPARRTVPGPLRLLFIALALQWLGGSIDLPLVERQFWSATRAMLFTVALVWVALMVARVAERYLLQRLGPSALGDTTSLLRVARRTGDAFIFVVGGLALLRFFGINATAALAGLGIGGIAVALSAQKTLENVIGGLSIIFDEAVKVGDTVRIGTMTGAVEYVGLRSTRIRTVDRTVVTIPNGQIATLNIETLSDRDKFWFHHVIGVTYTTTAEQLRAITSQIRDRLLQHTRVDDSSVRVRVVRFAPSSIDVEVSVYLFAQDWDNFLEMQEGLLLDVMAIVERHGSSMAFPTQTIQVAGSERLLHR